MLGLSGIVVRIERACANRLRGPLRTRVDRLFSMWNVGLSLGGPGFSATLQRNPNTNVEAVLLRLLDLPRDAASYAFAGSAPATMEGLFADPRRPLLEQAVPKTLPPLPLDEVGDYVRERFGQTERDPGDALAAPLGSPAATLSGA